MLTFSNVEQLTAAIGEPIGPTDWMVVDQARIDAFADCTNDRQWIHVDARRAAEGPFGTTIAHGYLTLSLVPQYSAQLYAFDTPGPKINYGLNTVRFPAPVPVGSRIRATATISSVEPLPAGTQVVVRYVIEIEGSERPACVADAVVLLLG